MIRIFIPSRGRANRQLMAEALAEARIPFQLVLARNDPTLDEYKKLPYRYITVSASDIREKRQRILERAQEGKIVMMDDDLRIYARKKDGRFGIATSSDLVKLMSWFQDVLEDHAHAGLVDKFMSQNRPRGSVGYGRYNQVLAYNLDLFPKRPRPEFRFFVNSDHDMHFQLAAAGLPPIISCEFSKDARYYARGGFDYRKAKTERESKELLEATWPGYVRLAPTKHSVSGLAIRVKWKKLVEDGLRKRKASRRER